MPKTILLIQIFSIAAAGELVAQDIDRKPWDLTLHIYPSLSSSASDWSMTHPIYGASGGVSYETITGTFEQSLSVTVGWGMRRGNYGIQGNVSFLPQTLTKSQPVHEIDLTLVMGE
ncbi:MAG: hypothetical protein JSU61_04280, partial [Fidelibacterota bacterium]